MYLNTYSSACVWAAAQEQAQQDIIGAEKAISELKKEMASLKQVCTAASLASRTQRHADKLRGSDLTHVCCRSCMANLETPLTWRSEVWQQSAQGRQPAVL